MTDTAMTDVPVKDPSPSPTCASEQTVTWTPTQATYKVMELASSHPGQTQPMSQDQSSREAMGSYQEHQLAETSPEFDSDVNNSRSGAVATASNATYDPLGLRAYKSDSQSAASNSLDDNQAAAMVNTRYRLNYTGPAFPTVQEPALPNLADSDDPTGINGRRLTNYRSFEANQAFLMAHLYQIDSRLFGPRFHTRFLIKTIGTIQCDQCKSKNLHTGGEVYKCHTCANQICRVCVEERLSREEHEAANPPEDGEEPYVWEWNGVGTHEGFKLCYLERKDKTGGRGSWSVQFVGYVDDKAVVPNGVVEMVMSADGQGRRKRKEADVPVTSEKEKVKVQRQEGPDNTRYAANAANTDEQHVTGLQTRRPGANRYYHPAMQSHPPLLSAERLQYAPTEHAQSNVQMPPAAAAPSELGNNRATTQEEQGPRRFSAWDGKEIRGYVYNPQQQSRSNDQRPATLGTSESGDPGAVTEEEQAPKRYSAWDGKEIQPFVYHPEHHSRSNVQRAAAASSTVYGQGRDRSSASYNYGRPSYNSYGLINGFENAPPPVDVEEYYEYDETLPWNNNGHGLNNDVPSFTGFDDLTFLVPNLVYGLYPPEPNVEQQQPAPRGNDMWQALLDASNDAYAELLIDELEGLTWADMTPAQVSFANELGRRGAYTEHERVLWEMLREMPFKARETTGQENTTVGSETEAGPSSVTRESEAKAATEDDDETVDEDGKSQEARPAPPSKSLRGGRLRSGKEYTS